MDPFLPGVLININMVPRQKVLGKAAEFWRQPRLPASKGSSFTLDDSTDERLHSFDML
jgi:hypothetical protein